MSNAFLNIISLKKEWESASDRAAVIIGGAFLDDILKELLQSFFCDDKNKNEIFEGSKPAATFSGKIDLCSSLGLISNWETKTLHTIRKIRNEFAHVVVDISFDVPSIKSRCQNIQIPENLIMPVNIPLTGDEQGRIPYPELIKADKNNIRKIFEESIICLMHMLAARSTTAALSKRKIPADYLHAHEPAEELMNHTKLQLSKLDEQIKKLEELGENFEQAPLEKHRSMLKIQEFTVDAIKGMHGLI